MSGKLPKGTGHPTAQAILLTPEKDGTPPLLTVIADGKWHQFHAPRPVLAVTIAAMAGEVVMAFGQKDDQA